MNTLQKFVVSAGVVLNAALSPTLFAQTATAPENIQTLQGDVRLACEAILCLASGVQPAECDPSLNRFYSIIRPKYSWTIAARLAFLRQCPVAYQTPEMQSLVNAESNAYNRCDADSLNELLKKYITYRCCDLNGDTCWDHVVTYIANDKPSYCRVLENHEYTRLNTATYVGEPLMNGYWTPKSNYDDELVRYNNGKKRDLRNLNGNCRRVDNYGN